MGTFWTFCDEFNQIYQRIDSARFRELVENGNGLPRFCRLSCWRFIYQLYFTRSPRPAGRARPLHAWETSVTRGIPIGVGGDCRFLCADRNLYLAGECRRPDRLNNAVLHEAGESIMKRILTALAAAYSPFAAAGARRDAISGAVERRQRPPTGRRLSCF